MRFWDHLSGRRVGRKGGLHENTYVLACKGLCKIGKQLNVDFRKIVQGKHTEVNTNVKL